MRIKARSYEGIVLELDGEVRVMRDYTREIARVIKYRVVILCDDGAKVELTDVKPKEIEVVNEPCEMIQATEAILKRGNNAEVRRKGDGYIVLEVKKTIQYTSA